MLDFGKITEAATTLSESLTKGFAAIIAAQTRTNELLEENNELLRGYTRLINALNEGSDAAPNYVARRPVEEG